MTEALLAGLGALVLTLGLTPLVMTSFRRHGVLDLPVARSSHRVATVRGGGLGAAVAGTVVVTWQSESLTESVIVGAAAAFALVGLLDDLRGVPPLPRLALQLVIAAGAVSVLFSSTKLPVGLALMWAVVAVLWIVSYVNAFNFMDGIDGISSAQGFVAGVSAVLVGSHLGIPALQLSGAAAAGCAAGFAVWNVPRAKVFLGDVGSYFFGGLLATMVLVGVLRGAPVEAVGAPLALYLADTSTTLLRRVRLGEPVLLPHRTHVYQRLTDLGWSHAKVSATVGVVSAVCAALGAVSLVAGPIARVTADLALLGVVACYLRSPVIVRDHLAPHQP